MTEISRGDSAARAIANAISGLKLPKELAVTNLFDMAASLSAPNAARRREPDNLCEH
jgi:hypothetical protein